MNFIVKTADSLLRGEAVNNFRLLAQITLIYRVNTEIMAHGFVYIFRYM